MSRTDRPDRPDGGAAPPGSARTQQRTRRTPERRNSERLERLRPLQRSYFLAACFAMIRSLIFSYVALGTTFFDKSAFSAFSPAAGGSTANACGDGVNTASANTAHRIKTKRSNDRIA